MKPSALFVFFNNVLDNAILNVELHVYNVKFDSITCRLNPYTVTVKLNNTVYILIYIQPLFCCLVYFCI